MKNLWAKITSSARMIYFAGFCWWVLIAAAVWSWLGWTEAQFVSFVFPYMAALFAAVLGVKTATDMKKIPGGKTPEGETK